ncbi:MAG TPA: GNAT family N-acetyltransferase [Solirubrobacterales bacterium]|nr:GNAT family N-acetyltransferase [Solirubrobacterales bacterium]
MGIPQDDAAWLGLVRGGMPTLWGQLAEGSGGSTLKRDGVLACIVPSSPERSVFNSVFYEDGKRLIAALDRIAAAYEEAGVRAWTVWVPQDDRETAAALEEAGHLLDAEPRAMAMELSGLRAPEPDPTIEIRAELDMPEVARLNEIAYGWAPGEFGAVADTPIPGTYAYFASLEGETVGTVVVWDHGVNSDLDWVATLPETRGRGVSKQLTARALADARERGQVTTTLVATKLGRPVYHRVGYRDFGAIQMWECRKPA